MSSSSSLSSSSPPPPPPPPARPTSRCCTCISPKVFLVAHVVISELSERFAFYGSRSLLPLYLRKLNLTDAQVVSFISYFTAGCYVSPLLGGYVADALWGRYNTIFRACLVYILGGLILTLSAFGILGEGEVENNSSGSVGGGIVGLSIGLVFLAIGTGGVKANVASFGADQLAESSAAVVAISKESTRGRSVRSSETEIIQRKEPEMASETDKKEREQIRIPENHSHDDDKDDDDKEEETENTRLAKTNTFTNNIKPITTDKNITNSNSSTTSQNLTTYFFAFYVAINVGSLISYAVLPSIRQTVGFGPAFATVLVMLVLSLLTFVWKRSEYTRVAPQGSVLSRAARVMYFAACRRPTKGLTGTIEKTVEGTGHSIEFSLMNSGSSTTTTTTSGSGCGYNNNSGMDNHASSSSSEHIPLMRKIKDYTVVYPHNNPFPPAPVSKATEEYSGSEENTKHKNMQQQKKANDDNLTLTNTWLDVAHTEAGVPLKDVHEVAAVLRLLPIFAMLPCFWAIYDNYSAIFTLQATRMDLCITASVCLQPESFQIVNPLLVVVMIPVSERLIRFFTTGRTSKDPNQQSRQQQKNQAPSRRSSSGGWRWWCRFFTCPRPTPLKRMSLGMFVAAGAWSICGLLESLIVKRAEAGENKLSVAWQFWQYLALSIAEILVSTTGLEFSYRQAPETGKGLVLSMWFLATAAGDVLNGGIYQNLGETLSQLDLIWVSVCIQVAAAVVFAYAAWKYVPRVKEEEEESG